jgi:alkaline phosphatase
MYYDISMEIGKSGFDFFGGAGFREPTPEGKESLWNNLKENGYTVVRSLDEVNSSKSNKTVLIQPEGESAHSFPYAIDKSSTNYTLANVTEAAVKKLDNKKGFFLMVEGGMIDWASHNNDAGAMFGEMMEFSDAVKVALEFYKKYPKQTLIVITADHETGGLSIGKAEGSVLNVLNVESQNSSIYVLEDELKKPISFSMFHALVVNDLGGALSFTDEARLRDLFYQHAKKKPVDDDTECKLTETTNLSKEIGRMVSAGSGANYSTFNHTGTMVPVYAIGAGSELFRGKMDNTDIPKKIAKAARVDWK